MNIRIFPGKPGHAMSFFLIGPSVTPALKSVIPHVFKRIFPEFF